MIDVDFIRTFARYNQWQNRSLYGAASGLSAEERLRDRGAFFSSIHGTLSHILWGDLQWMSRFAPELVAKPPALVRESPGNYPDWEDLKARRIALDQTILDWSRGLPADWADGDLYWYSGIAKANVSKPKWFTVAHFFNHQTHHRGQVHAMLTAAGVKPDDTDLFLMSLA